jgi:hypothetical protein
MNSRHTPSKNVSGECENIYMQQEDVYSLALRNWLLNITQFVSYKLGDVSVLLADSVLGTHYTTLLLYIRCACEMDTDCNFWEAGTEF